MIFLYRFWLFIKSFHDWWSEFSSLGDNENQTFFKIILLYLFSLQMHSQDKYKFSDLLFLENQYLLQC